MAAIVLPSYVPTMPRATFAHAGVRAGLVAVPATMAKAPGQVATAQRTNQMMAIAQAASNMQASSVQQSYQGYNHKVTTAARMPSPQVRGRSPMQSPRLQSLSRVQSPAVQSAVVQSPRLQSPVVQSTRATRARSMPAQRLSSAPQLPTQRNSLKRILCYGDSLTAGFYRGGDAFEPYGYNMTNALGALGVEGSNVRVMGLSGKTARECMQGLQSSSIMDATGRKGKGLARLLAEEGSFDLAIIMLGTNDLGKSYSIQEIMSSIQQLHSVCHSMNIPTVVIAPPQLDHGSYRAQRNQLAQQLEAWSKSNQKIVGYVDCEAFCPRRELSLWEPDKIHLSPLGSQTLGRSLAKWLHDRLMSGAL